MQTAISTKILFVFLILLTALGSISRYAVACNHSVIKSASVSTKVNEERTTIVKNIRHQHHAQERRADVTIAKTVNCDQMADDAKKNQQSIAKKSMEMDSMPCCEHDCSKGCDCPTSGCSSLALAYFSVGSDPYISSSKITLSIKFTIKEALSSLYRPPIFA